jgi:transcription termination factor Rho
MEDREKLQGKSLEDLRYIAKVMGIKSITRYRKQELIDKILSVGAESEETAKPVQSFEQRRLGRPKKIKDVPESADATVGTQESVIQQTADSEESGEVKTESRRTEKSSEPEVRKPVRRGCPPAAKEEEKTEESAESKDESETKTEIEEQSVARQNAEDDSGRETKDETREVAQQSDYVAEEKETQQEKAEYTRDYRESTSRYGYNKDLSKIESEEPVSGILEVLPDGYGFLERSELFVGSS